MSIDVKTLFLMLSVFFGVASFFFYIRGIVRREVSPHFFTWFIWLLTQTTATVGVWVGGGGKGAISITIGTLLIVLVCILTLFFGKKDITKSDIVIFCLALFAICLWWIFHNPILSIFAVSLIDLMGFIPTFRKSFSSPWSESLMYWGMDSLSFFFGILALEHYNFFTLPYLTALVSANVSFCAFLIFRRMSGKKILPQNEICGILKGRKRE